MGLPEDAVEIVKSFDGVVDAFLMDDDISYAILNEERSVVSVTQMDVINNAYEEVMSRRYRICMIFDNVLYKRVRDAPSILMVNSKGETIGTSVSDDMVEEYSKRKDLMWISSDFVVFMNAPADGKERFIIPASSFPELNDVKGYSDAITSSPATTSDMMLKKYRGLPFTKSESTSVIGFNITSL